MNRFNAIKNLSRVCLLGAAGAACAADIASAPSLPGRWNVTLQTAAASYALELTVTQDARRER